MIKLQQQQIVLLLLVSSLLLVLVPAHGETSDDPDFTDMQELINPITGAAVAKLYYRLDALDEALLPSGATTSESDGTMINAITFKMVYDGTTAWLGLGPSPNSQMINTIATIGIINKADGSSTVQTYGPFTEKSGYNLIELDGRVVDASITQENSQTILMYTQPLLNADGDGRITYDLSGCDNPMAFAIGGSDNIGFPSYHSGGRGTFTLRLSNVERPSGTNTTSDNATSSITSNRDSNSQQYYQ